MFTFHNTLIDGCYHVKTKVLDDERGYFIKSFQKSTFKNSPIHREINFTETYYSLSKRGVIRGMHFQSPPAQLDKLVHVSVGSILDVVLDLRKESPTFGKHFSFELNEHSGDCIFIPQGCAHGFLTLSTEAIVNYQQTHEYSPQHDHGILWNSFGMNWGEPSPIISKRDLNFQTWEQFAQNPTLGF